MCGQMNATRSQNAAGGWLCLENGGKKAENKLLCMCKMVDRLELCDENHVISLDTWIDLPSVMSFNVFYQPWIPKLQITSLQIMRSTFIVNQQKNLKYDIKSSISQLKKAEKKDHLFCLSVHQIKSHNILDFRKSPWESV